jgi:hypothetical protein
MVEYVLALMTDVNPAENYRIDTIYKIKQLVEFHNPKSFKTMTRQDAIDFLERVRKPEALIQCINGGVCRRITASLC